MDDDIRLVPIRDLLRNLTDSCDCYDLDSAYGWLDMMADKASDEEFPALLRALVAEGQRDPIAILEWYGADGEPLWELGNGHHRVTAAILLGWEEISCLFTIRATDDRSGYGSEHDTSIDWARPGDRAEARELAVLIHG